MYEVLISDINGKAKHLYYPADEQYIIHETDLNHEVGSAGEFSFRVPFENPSYNLIDYEKTITILKNEEEYWEGSIKEIDIDFKKTVEVYCVEDITWLNNEPLAAGKIENETYFQRLSSVINQYNSKQSDSRKFEIGIISNVNPNNICNWEIEYGWTILDGIRECICRDNGYIKVRRKNGKKYIDILRLQDYGKNTSQEIKFGRNLLDFAKEIKRENFANVVFPYGAETDEELYEGVFKRIVGNTVENIESQKVYGRSAKSVIFETESLDELNILAQAYVTRYSQPELTMEISAVDLSQVYVDVESIDIGDSVQIIAEPFAINQKIYLTKLEIDIQNIANNKLTLSSTISTGRSLTDQTSMLSEELKKVPSPLTILDSAKKSALNILTGNDGGWVRFVTDENETITAIEILNGKTDEFATQKWVFNSGGLGHLEKQDREWKNLNVAMTMDGSIVADAITSGKLKSIEIEGVTINGATINTLLNGSVNSRRSDGSGVAISGGSIIIYNTRDSYLKIVDAKDPSRYVTLGANTWTVARTNEGYYQEFDPRKLSELAARS